MAMTEINLKYWVKAIEENKIIILAIRETYIRGFCIECNGIFW